jgi:hypothetical protein
MLATLLTLTMLEDIRTSRFKQTNQPTTIVPKPTKEEMQQAILKANKGLNKCAGHTTRY